MPLPVESPAVAVVQIVPPGAGGVRDFATALGTQWAAKGERAGLIELAAPADGRPALARLVAPQAAAHASLALVLHYSGYGYGHRGLCGWLVDEVDAVRHAFGQRLTLAVVFHEVYARGEPPWRSAFWLAPWQAQIARRLAQRADAVWTNTEDHAAWLRRQLQPWNEVQVWPVFSNVGEPEHARDAAQRPPQALLFGGASTRQRALTALRGRHEALRRWGIERLVEAGPGASVLGGQPLAGLEHSFVGALPAERIGELLADSRAGLIEYPPYLLGKSGVFAAYAAHGCAVLNLSGSGPRDPTLTAGRHYLTPDALPDRLPTECGIELRRWYLGHTLARQAHALRRLLSAIG
jgi:hypothetical protein